jgi:hypothetical protein
MPAGAEEATVTEKQEKSLVFLLTKGTSDDVYHGP